MVVDVEALVALVVVVVAEVPVNFFIKSNMDFNQHFQK